MAITRSQIPKQVEGKLRGARDEKIVESLRKKINIASEVLGEELKAWI